MRLEAEIGNNPRVPATLAIPEIVVEQLRNHTLRAYPHECCGILLGRNQSPKNRAVSAAIQCRNTHMTPETHYAIAPADIVSAQRKAREQGCAIVGFYHSHPNRPAVASATDIADAFWQGCSYLILSVSKESILELNSFYCSAEQKLVPEQLEVIS